MGRSLPEHRQALEGQLGAGDSVLRISAGRAPSHLHHQRGGILAYEPAQNHQNARIISKRRSGFEALVSGAAQRQRQVGCSSALEASAQPFPDAMGRSHPGRTEPMRTRTQQCRRNWPAAARDWNAPFPVSPSGGKPGREGSPHAGQHAARPAKSAGTHRAPAPPTRGLPPPCAIPCEHGLQDLANCKTPGTLLRAKQRPARNVYTKHLTLPVDAEFAALDGVFLFALGPITVPLGLTAVAVALFAVAVGLFAVPIGLLAVADGLLAVPLG